MSRRVIVVTGAARGIGYATAMRLAQDKDALVLSGRDAATLEPVADEVRAFGAEAVVFAGDVREEAVVRGLMETAISAFGRLDGLVNAAGIAKNVALLELDLATWNELFSLHATAAFLCSQAAARVLVKQGEGGAIVNISSMAASMSMYTTGAYAAAKAAVSSLTRTLAVELAEAHITVNAVAPGPVATEQLRKVYGEAGYADRSRSIPLNRLAEPAEVAGLIAFLLGPEAHYISGQVIGIDGGATAVGGYSFDTYRRHGSTAPRP